MGHVDQRMLIKIITENNAIGTTEQSSWKQRHWINLDGGAVPQEEFWNVSPCLYVEVLISDTIDVVDYYIEQMIIQGKDEFGGNV